MSDRNAFGTLSRPLSSIRAGALPLNTRWPTSIGHSTPQKSTAIVEKAQLEVNRKIYGISNLRKISTALSPKIDRAQQILAYARDSSRDRLVNFVKNLS